MKQFQYYKLLPPTPDHTKLAWRGLSQMDFVTEQNTRSVPYSVTSIGSHPHETKLTDKTRHAAVIIFFGNRAGDEQTGEQGFVIVPLTPEQVGEV